MEKEKINLCIFGAFSRDSIRTHVLIKAIESINEYNMAEINEIFPKFQELPLIIYLKEIFIKLWILTKQLIKVRCDILIIPYPGIFAVLLAKIFKNVPILFDPFISIYESNMSDYKTLKPNSIITKIYFYIEKIAFKSANIIISDTNMHALLFKRLFHLKKPIYRVIVGMDSSLLELSSNNDLVDTKKTSENKFIVSFIGNYIPLHGIEHIIKSSEYLGVYSDKIEYEIIGGKPEQQAPFKDYCHRKNIKNVKFIDPMPLKDLPKYIYHSQIQLGIFGTTPKSKRVIPTKAYVAIAAKKALITSDTPAIHELFEHKNNVFLCKAGDPNSIANAIITLYNDDELRQKIARNGYNLFNIRCAPKPIGKKVDNIIQSMIKLK